MMNEKMIWDKLNSLYEDKNSQKFIDHLIKSYIPKSKIEKVVEHPKGRFRCAITNFQLIAIEDVFKEIGNDETKKSQFIDFVDAMLDNNTAPAPKIDILKNKSLGLTGKNTDTFLRQETFKAFFNWIQQKILDGDKHIYWLIKQMQAEEDFTIKRVKDNEEEKVKFVKKPQKVRATFGDLDALQELQKKLKEQENK